MNTIHQSIALERQPTWTIVRVSPDADYIADNNWKSTGNYETYSYTGNEAQIITQENLEHAQAISSLNRITTTRTRLNGKIWQLEVKKDNHEIETEEQTSAETEKFEGIYGSASNKKLKNVSISTLTQDILLNPRYKDCSNLELSIIRMYQNGSTGNDEIPEPNPQGTEIKSVPISNYVAYDDPLVTLALKYKTYLVPNISLTFGWFSRQRPTIDLEIPKFITGSIDGLRIPVGWQAMYCGRTYNAVIENNRIKGYEIEENYTIGQYPVELYEEVEEEGGEE